MIVVDASVWVSLLLPTDSNHMATTTWTRRNLPPGVAPYVPRLMFAEVAGALSRRLENPEAGLRAIANIKRLSQLQVIDLDASLLDDAAHLAATLGVRGADATYIAVAQRYAIPLLTWDRDQATRASTVVLTQTPG